MTAELPVVHLKIRHCAARLTSPAVATQDLLAQTFTTRGLAARERLWDESFSGRLLTQVFEESVLLFAGQEIVVA
jgi:hypothetical protein